MATKKTNKKITRSRLLALRIIESVERRFAEDLDKEELIDRLIDARIDLLSKLTDDEVIGMAETKVDELTELI